MSPRRTQPICATYDRGNDNSRARLKNLRAQLAQALQSENFMEAATLRDAIQTLEASTDDDIAITVANDAFYDAFRTGNADVMASTWMEADNVSCAHTLSGLVTGFDDVIQSWRSLFAQGRPTDVNFEVLSMQVRRNLSWVICRQFITTIRGQGSIAGERVATNVFQKQKGRWRLVHHHSSPVVVDDAEQERSDDM